MDSGSAHTPRGFVRYGEASFVMTHISHSPEEYSGNRRPKSILMSPIHNLVEQVFAHESRAQDNALHYRGNASSGKVAGIFCSEEKVTAQSAGLCIPAIWAFRFTVACEGKLCKWFTGKVADDEWSW